ncbi:MAG: FAD binding domain-containing protein [Cypionkella sp.]
MNLFDYTRPASVAEAIAAWEPGSAWLGGGTNLVDLMKTGALQPGKLIDLTRLPGLDRIETLADGSTRIGALVRNADLAHDPEFASTFPMIAEALLSGASGQLRNAATVGGNLMQRTRCAYFQDPHSACNRRSPGAGCDAKDGDNSGHAVLGWNEGCIATNPSDFCVPLAALDAVVEVQGPNGLRDIAFADFHRLPGDMPAEDTALEPGELILAIRLPAAAVAFKGHARYLKLRERTSFAFAIVSAAAALRLEGGKIVEARLALGAVAAKPWRVAAAEALLVGQPPGPDLFARAAAVALAGAAPSGDNAHKIELARRTTVRVLALAAAGTPARMPALPASPFGDYAHV